MLACWVPGDQPQPLGPPSKRVDQMCAPDAWQGQSGQAVIDSPEMIGETTLGQTGLNPGPRTGGSKQFLDRFAVWYQRDWTPTEIRDHLAVVNAQVRVNGRQ